MIKKQKALIVGGSNGIGLALAMRLVKEKSVLIVDKVEPDYSQVPSDIKHWCHFGNSICCSMTIHCLMNLTILIL